MKAISRPELGGVVNDKAWLTSNYPHEMLQHIRGRKVSDRKYRRYTCACLRGLVPLFELDDAPEALAGAMAVAERLAEGEATADEVRAARRQTAEPPWGLRSRAGDPAYVAHLIRNALHVSLWPDAELVAWQATIWCIAARREAAAERAAPESPRPITRLRGTAEDVERTREADLLRDILGHSSVR